MGGLKQIRRRGKRCAKRDPQRSDRGIPGDPPKSFQLLSSKGEILRRLEKAEVDAAEESKQTSGGCYIILINMSIRYDEKASGGVDSTTTLVSLGRGDALSENQSGFRKGRSTADAIQAVVDVAIKARRGIGKRNGFCALISIDICNAFNTARWKIWIGAMAQKKVPDYPLQNRIISKR